MFKRSYLMGLSICLLSGVIAGCQQSSDSNSDQAPPDYTKRLSEPINTFYGSGKDLDVKTVSTDAISKMLGCELPTTEQRIEGESLAISYKVVSRSQNSVDGVIVTKDEDKGYSTTSNGSMFKKTYTLNHFTIGDASPLTSGHLSYRDTCTANGCDTKQREYLAGSALYLVEVDVNIQKILKDLEMKPRKECRFVKDSSGTEQNVLEGHYHLAGVNYRGVRLTTTDQGDLYCSSRTLGSDVYVGKAMQKTVQIVVGDKIPHIHNELPSYNASCARTMVFSGSYTASQDNATLYFGQSTEVNRATVEAKILTVDEFKKRRQEKMDLIERLRTSVTLANAEKNDADLAVGKAKTALQEAQAESSRLELEAGRKEAKAAQTGATDADKAAAIEARALASASAANVKSLTAVLQSKEELRALAERKLREAQDNLARAERDNKF